MALKSYFENLLKKVEASDIENNGKDANGFFSPTRTLLIRHLTLLRDLHAKPNAKPMVTASWNFVAEHLPPDWLTPDDAQAKELRQILG